MQERLHLPQELLAQAPADLAVVDALAPALLAPGAQAPGPLADLWARAKLGAARHAALRSAAAASARLAAAVAAATGGARDSVLQQSAWRHARPQVHMCFGSQGCWNVMAHGVGGNLHWRRWVSTALVPERAPKDGQLRVPATLLAGVSGYCIGSPCRLLQVFQSLHMPANPLG